MKNIKHSITNAFDKIDDFIERKFWTIICIILFIMALNYYCIPNA